jgi:serine protease Do
VLQVWRKGNTRDVPVTIGEMQEEKQAGARQARPGKVPEQAANRLGLVVSELSSDQKRDLKMSSGLVVDEVRPGGPRADLRQGDIIIAVIAKGATTEIKTVEQFNKVLSQFEKGSNVTLLIRRGEMQTFVTVKGINGN